MSERPSQPPSFGRASVAAGPVGVELTPAQVDRIVRQASGAGTMSVLLSGLQGARGTIQDNRGLLGISEGDLAERCNLFPTTIIRMEQGQHEPKLCVLLVICQRLHVSPDTLLAGLLPDPDGDDVPS